MVRIAQQRKIELFLFFEGGLSLDGIGAHAKDHDTELVELSLCVTKLGRFDDSTGGVGLGKEKEQDALALEVVQSNVLAVVRLEAEAGGFGADFEHPGNLALNFCSLPTGVQRSLSSAQDKAAPLQRWNNRTNGNQESSLRRTSLTACALAWPRVARMTWPTKNLNTPSLPALYFATFSRFFAITSRAACWIAASLTCAPRPPAATISAALRPDSNMVAKTFFPIAPVIWLDSTSLTSSASAAGEMGLASISLPESFKRRRSSVCS